MKYSVRYWQIVSKIKNYPNCVKTRVTPFDAIHISFHHFFQYTCNRLLTTTSDIVENST